jgi:hypothetical protein
MAWMKTEPPKRRRSTLKLRYKSITPGWNPKPQVGRFFWSDSENAWLEAGIEGVGLYSDEYKVLAWWKSEPRAKKASKGT